MHVAFYVISNVKITKTRPYKRKKNKKTKQKSPLLLIGVSSKAERINDLMLLRTG